MVALGTTGALSGVLAYGPVSKLIAEQPFYDVDLEPQLGIDTLASVSYAAPSGSGLVIDGVAVVGNDIARGRFKAGNTGTWDVVGTALTVSGQTIDFIIRVVIAAGAAWTYGASPQTSALDAIRLLVGDTDSSDQLIDDAAINYAISVRGSTNTLLAASDTARAIAAKLMRNVAFSVDGQSLQPQQAVEAFKKLATELEQRSRLIGGVMPYAGGVSISDMDATRSDDDRLPNIFRIGIMDNRGTLRPVPPEDISPPGFGWP